MNDSKVERECSLEEFEELETWIPAVALRDGGKATFHPLVGGMAVKDLEIPRELVASVLADESEVGREQRVRVRVSKPVSFDLAAILRAFEPLARLAQSQGAHGCAEGCTACDFTGFQTCTFWDDVTKTCVTTRNQCATPNTGFFGNETVTTPYPWWGRR